MLRLQVWVKERYMCYFFVICLFLAFLLKGSTFKCNHRQTALFAKHDKVYKHFISWSKTLTYTEVDQYVGTQKDLMWRSWVFNIMSGICMFQLQIEFVLAWAQGSNVMLKCLIKHSAMKMCRWVQLAHCVFIPWTLDASDISPYFSDHKTHFFSRKMWPKFDLHLIRRG